jgi:OmpA-OmpF porin, OOP family
MSIFGYLYQFTAICRLPKGEEMRRIIATMVTAMLFMVGVQSSANEGFYVGPSVTGYYLDNERYVGGAEDPITFGVNLGYRFFNDWALELGAATDIAADDFEVVKLDFYYWFGENTASWRPYFTLGLAYYEQDFGTSTALSDPDQAYTHQASVGFGLSKMLNTHWEFRGDVRLLHQIREGHDGLNDGALNFALNYYFNPPVVKPAVVEVVPEPARAVEPKPELPPEMRTIVVRLNVEFEFDKAVVRAIYGSELEAVANAMKAHEDIELLLEGHTDAIGTDQYNQGLSERRVAAVKAKLVEDYALDAGRISTVGYGESRPIADNKTDEGRARNRRVIGELSYTEVVVD